MQRRAAAIYAAFFLIVAAGAYAMIGVAQVPTVQVQHPDYALSAGQTFSPPGGPTYTVGQVKSGTNQGNDLRSTSLSWVNQSARYTASFGNNTTVAAANVVWAGQTARHTTTLQNGSSVSIGGTSYQLTIASGASSFTLTAGGSSETHGVGDTLTYQGNQATVTDITGQSVTLAWGEPYRVLIENTQSPAAFTLTQDFNVTARLKADPAVEDQTVTRADGHRYVVFTANGSTERLSSYLPPPDSHTFQQGGTLRYAGNDTTIVAVTNQSVTLAWTAPRTNSFSLEEGDTHTFGGTEYAAHFPDNATLQLTSDVKSYQAELDAVDYYHERINGLWGVSFISGLGALLILAAAYLPSRY